ncbi:MAG TPA: PEP/pyruvate-binding domain-containing protein, partial [Gemmatimonadaceae bacterium]
MATKPSDSTTVGHAEPEGTAAASAAPLIRTFDQIGRGDVATVGGKGANLGEMLHASLPVPPGFVITIDAYHHFYESGDIGGAITALLAAVDVDDPDSLQTASRSLRDLVIGAEIPADLRAAILNSYRSLPAARDGGNAIVAVRSSATAEDTQQFSFAGMFESYLNVQGEAELLGRVKECWASTFGARVLFYRLKQGMPAEMPLAVIVQLMVDSTKSGVMFTVDPATRDSTHIVIEAAWGLGEVVVGGQVTPDRYVVDKSTLATVATSIARKNFLLVRDASGTGNVRVDLSHDPRGEARVLSDAELHTIAQLGVRSEEHYGAPQDVEFAIEGDAVYLTQTRPITTLANQTTSQTTSVAAHESLTDGRHADGDLLVRGLGASPGTASGNARILTGASEAGSLRAGEVLIARMTSPDWVPIMK